MKKLLLLTLFLATTATFAFAQTTFILVRHAEKQDDGTSDPSLNEAGKVRANTLATMLSDQEIVALYSTPFKRTKETLTPLSNQIGVGITEYDPFSKKEWLEGLAKQHEEGTVVIAGHSNTIPFLANALLGKDNFAQFDESDYSNLIVIVGEKVGEGTLVRFRF